MIKSNRKGINGLLFAGIMNCLGSMSVAAQPKVLGIDELFELAEAELDNDKQNIRFMLVGHYLDLYQLNNQKKVYQKNIEQTRLLSISSRYCQYWDLCVPDSVL